MRAAAAALMLASHSPVVADDDPTVGSYTNGFTVMGQHQEQTSDPLTKGRSSAASGGEGAASAPSSRPRYEWRTTCAPGIGAATTGAPVCPTNTCAAGEAQYRLWQVAPPPARPIGLVCSGTVPPSVAAEPAPPQVTEAMVLQAFRRVPLPVIWSHTQPADKTLINFETIFFTHAEPLTRRLTLLGQRVRLEITPARFEWQHGDGTTATTTTPGAPYPATDIVTATPTPTPPWRTGSRSPGAPSGPSTKGPSSRSTEPSPPPDRARPFASPKPAPYCPEAATEKGTCCGWGGTQCRSHPICSSIPIDSGRRRSSARSEPVSDAVPAAGPGQPRGTASLCPSEIEAPESEFSSWIRCTIARISPGSARSAAMP